MTQDKISYLASCYQADFRAVHLLNFFSKKVGHPLFFESSEMLSGEHRVMYPVPIKWAQEVEKTLSVYGKEKSLFCCAVFLAGWADIAGKEETVMAPVYLYPAELVEVDNVFHVTIDEENPVINPAIVDVEANSDVGKYEAFSSALPKGFFSPENILDLQQVLTSFFPDWDANPMLLFPNVVPMEGAKILQKKAQVERKPCFLPALGLCLVDKPAGSRGILNELAAMAEDRLSTPVQVLLNQPQKLSQKPTSTASNVPALLSKRQAAILANAGRFPLQLVIGPPGTGKSFTIAALAIEMLSKGKSVLIASKNNEACNVVADKIERDLDLQGLVVRASKSDYKVNLQKRLQDLLNGIDIELLEKWQLNRLKKQKEQLKERIEKLESKIEKRQDRRLVDGVFLHQYDGGLVQKIQKMLVTWRHENTTPIWKLGQRFESLLHERNHVLRSYLKYIFNFRLNEALDFSRLEIQNMVSAAKARTGNRKESFFDAIDFDVILRTLPIWTVNMADVHRVLPLKVALFDLVIIDEATQSDMASSLPILQRGKSALVVGDPKQLRHLSFLSSRQQQDLAKKYQLSSSETERFNYRENSLLDLVSMSLPSQEQVHFLDEHYRSMPDIIAFSNAQFYNERLHVMTATPSSKERQHLFLEKLDGKRHTRGHNPVEADYMISEVRRVMETEAILDATACQSIGIISPFREQVNHLLKRVEVEFSPDQLKRHRLMVGTPFDFQGEERDMVFLSFVLDNKSHPSAFQYLNRADVFNVSITRARSQQKVLISFEPEQLPATSLIVQYLTYIEACQCKTETPDNLDFQHEFVESVRHYLIEIGIEDIFQAYSVAGVQLDFLAMVGGRTYGIDLIGHPGHWGQPLHLEDWKMLYRTGIPVFYLSYSEWNLDEDTVKLGLKSFLFR